jgi:uncharacterized protein (TIGR03435 family)
MIAQLTNHLWQSTVFALAVTVLTFFFRKSGAHVRYWLWFSASIKFFIPFALLIMLGQRLEWAPAVREAASPAVSAAMVRISEPLFDSAWTVPPAPSSRARTVGWLGIAVPAVWVCGCIVIALARIRLWRRIRMVVDASLPLELPGSEIPPGIPVRSATGFLEPGVVGLWRPTLLLPAGLEHYLTPSQLRAVIAHELSHIRRRDNDTAAIHMLVEALFWFHPLVWWIGTRLVDERERACDEEVLRLLGEPETYAEGILVVCKRYVGAPLSCVSGVSGSNLMKRIEGIMNNRIGIRLTFAKKTVLALAALFALSTPILIGSMTAALPRAITPGASSVPSAEPASPQPQKPPPMSQSAQGTNPQPDKPVTPKSPTATATPEFEEASIRRCDPNNLPPPPDGMRGGGANSFQMTPGRTHALCMTLATLIRTAYGYSPANLDFAGLGGRGRGMNFDNVYGLGVEDGVRVRGGPDWVRSERYSIEAVAHGPSDPATMQGPMLRTLLERRFQLKLHIESEQIPAFALTVAKGGLKMKEGICTPADPSAPPLRSTTEMVRRNLAAARRGETTAGPCGFAGTANGPNSLFVGAGAGVPLVGPVFGVPVIDKTGIPKTARFNYVLEFAPDQSTAGPLGRELPPGFQLADDPSAVPLAPNIFIALEEQLGLRLEPAKAPREFLVIDHLERLSPN